MHGRGITPAITISKNPNNFPLYFLPLIPDKMNVTNERSVVGVLGVWNNIAVILRDREQASGILYTVKLNMIPSGPNMFYVW